MRDHLRRFLIENLDVRGEWVRLEKTWLDAQKHHAYPLPIQTILGEMMAAISLLSATLKYNGTLTLQIQGAECIKLLTAQISSDNKLRGVAQYSDTVLNEMTFCELLQGENVFMSMTIETKGISGKVERYQSLIGLEGASLAECLQIYFEHSEQLATIFNFYSDTNSAVGFMLQKLPDGDKLMSEMSEKASNDWQHAKTLAATITKEELASLECEELLHRLFHDEVLRLFDPEEITFSCTCSKDKVSQMILSLGFEEIEKILDEKDEVSINCEFCNANYSLDKVDITALFNENSVAQSDLESAQSKKIH